MLRWELHRWSTLFCHAQCLIALIYDWDRRSSRSVDMRLVSGSSFPTSSSSWLNPACLSAFHVDRLPRWLRRVGQLGAVALANAPFGYYSLLNPEGGSFYSCIDNSLINQ